MTSLEQSFKDSDKAKEAGYVIRYDVISYRGFEVPILSDVSGEHCVAQWNDQLIDLGLFNHNYKEDICAWIDSKLDLIYDFRNYDNFVGAKLTWFNNGGHRDILLSFKCRILRVFLVAEPPDETLLISESIKILTNYVC